MSRKLMAEMFGTFWLVFGGCGSAIYAANHASSLGIGFLGVSLAFGLTVVTMAYAIGHISGCHLNPAVSFGLMIGGRFSSKDLIPYWVAQCIGGILAGFCLMFIASGMPGWMAMGADGMNPWTGAGAFATNGWGHLSPTNFSMMACFMAEVLCTAFFLFVIMGATSKNAPNKAAPVAIGLCLTLIHLISIPITNTSVNPARSLGVAIPAAMNGSEALFQSWMFWVAPLIGAAIGAMCYRFCATGEFGTSHTSKRATA